uniref:Putative nonfluorescent protein n=1 Tax=Ctenophora sp. T WRF-2014 TaxID=1567052 RepID=A0A1C8YXP3_9METZ|nr:putative nonfluorescent protein [Ctenophora sp. T WRF-2014]
MNSRMERAEGTFTGISKSKVIAQVELGKEGEGYKITGEGYGEPLEGTQALELSSVLATPSATPSVPGMPVNFNIVGTLIQSNLRMFTQYRGAMAYDVFKTCFPGTMTTEFTGVFSDGVKVGGSCTITHVKDTLICRCQVRFVNLAPESLCYSDELGPTLPCYEAVDRGARVEEVTTVMDLVWRSGTDKYTCRLESTIKCPGNFSPQLHFIGHDYKLTERSSGNQRFAQRIKSRASVINFYKNH